MAVCQCVVFPRGTSLKAALTLCRRQSDGPEPRTPQAGPLTTGPSGSAPGASQLFKGLEKCLQPGKPFIGFKQDNDKIEFTNVKRQQNVMLG